jgi:hypothetical protein
MEKRTKLNKLGVDKGVTAPVRDLGRHVTTRPCHGHTHKPGASCYQIRYCPCTLLTGTESIHVCVHVKRQDE